MKAACLSTLLLAAGSVFAAPKTLQPLDTLHLAEEGILRIGPARLAGNGEILAVPAVASIGAGDGVSVVGRRFSATGKFRWDTLPEFPKHPLRVELAEDGSVYVGGRLHPDSGGVFRILKLDASGHRVWQTDLPDTVMIDTVYFYSQDVPSAMKLDGQGRLLVARNALRRMSGPNYSVDMGFGTILTLDSTGQVIGKVNLHVNPPENEEIHALCVDSEGNVLVTGKIHPYGNYDRGWIALLDSTMEVVNDWGVPGYHGGRSIAYADCRGASPLLVSQQPTSGWPPFFLLRLDSRGNLDTVASISLYPLNLPKNDAIGLEFLDGQYLTGVPSALFLFDSALTSHTQISFPGEMISISASGEQALVAGTNGGGSPILVQYRLNREPVGIRRPIRSPGAGIRSALPFRLDGRAAECRVGIPGSCGSPVFHQPR